MNIAIVGATGNVGRKILEVLEKKGLSIDNLYLIASTKSSGKKISFKGKEYQVSDLESFDFSKVKIAFFSAGGKISEKFAEKAAKNCFVIDNSSHYRMDPEVPLIVPQVNSEDLNNIKKNIIANPNCSTMQLMVVLAPLHKVYKIKRLVISTYQSVSGTGKNAIDQLNGERRDSDPEMIYPYKIDQNLLPHCDVFEESGYTKEENKLINETKKF